MDSEVRREGRFAWLKTAGLAVVAMAVVLIAGGIAVTAQRSRVLPARLSAPAPAAPVPAAAANATSVAQTAIPPTVSGSSTAAVTGAPATTPDAAPGRQVAAAIAPVAATSAASDTWVVQVGAFSSHERSQSLVERLTQSGFPAFEVPTEASRGLLYFVRVGPFTTAGEADEARARLRAITELENAFVRSVTSVP